MEYSAVNISEANNFWDETIRSDSYSTVLANLESATDQLSNRLNTYFVPVIGSQDIYLQNPYANRPGTRIELTPVFSSISSVVLNGRDITDICPQITYRGVITAIQLGIGIGYYTGGRLVISGTMGLSPQLRGLTLPDSLTLTQGVFSASFGEGGPVLGDVIGVSYTDDSTIYSYYVESIDENGIANVSLLGEGPEESVVAVDSVGVYKIPSAIKLSVTELAIPTYNKLRHKSTENVPTPASVYDRVRKYNFS